MLDSLLYVLANPFEPQFYWHWVVGAAIFVLLHIHMTWTHEGKISLLHVILGLAGIGIPGVNMIASLCGVILILTYIGTWAEKIIIVRKGE